jgi:hypothetical protein
MRSVAFQHLSAFTSVICSASLASRREFVDWLCEQSWQHRSADAGPLPEPLLRRVVRPTLEEWRNSEPTQSAPCRWSGVLLSAVGYQSMRAGFLVPTSEAQDFLTRAIKIDPADQIALVRLVECKIGVLNFQAHHLPEGYLGNPEVDLQLTEEAQSLCQRMRDDSERERLLKELGAARQLILDWMESRRAGNDFRAWCREHNRDYQWAITRVYVRDPKTSA